MLEQDLLPAEPAPAIAEQPREIDPRGWLAVIVLMVLVGVWSSRPSPSPAIPDRITTSRCEPWMVDALPGIGARTRERYRRVVQAGDLSALPQRAQAIARQVFTWSDSPRRSAIPVVP